ncbi:transcription initiation factor TFIIIB [Brevibacillus ginsengisoli]|uniref:transcription initiation factor TFIIIB n=1 Tax=Brevibacillus ginsengisoli TaxID=363854 RepID=UPI003CF31CCA
MNTEIQCPKCGGNEIGKGKQAGDAAVTPINKFYLIGSPIIHNICLNCGYVVGSYVENPSKFKR